MTMTMMKKMMMTTAIICEKYNKYLTNKRHSSWYRGISIMDKYMHAIPQLRTWYTPKGQKSHFLLISRQRIAKSKMWVTKNCSRGLVSYRQGNDGTRNDKLRPSGCLRNSFKILLNQQFWAIKNELIGVLVCSIITITLLFQLLHRFTNKCVSFF